MGQVLECESEAQRRRSARANVMLSASILVAGLPAKVRIRNISETGALLEGPVVPSKGAALILRRLEMQVAGTVVWSDRGRCGIRFDGTIAPRDWIGCPQPGASEAMAGQAGVDAVQEAIRSGLLVEAKPGRPVPGSLVKATPRELDCRLADELLNVRRQLEGMGDQLLSERIVVSRHARLLQQFDLAGQILGQLAGVIRSEDRAAAIAAIGRDDLRARLMREPLIKT